MKKNLNKYFNINTKKHNRFLDYYTSNNPMLTEDLNFKDS